MLHTSTGINQTLKITHDFNYIKNHMLEVTQPHTVHLFENICRTRLDYMFSEPGTSSDSRR